MYDGSVVVVDSCVDDCFTITFNGKTVRVKVLGQCRLPFHSYIKTDYGKGDDGWLYARYYDRAIRLTFSKFIPL
jgi:hypothetical protein